MLMSIHLKSEKIVQKIDNCFDIICAVVYPDDWIGDTTLVNSQIGLIVPHQ